MKQVLAVMICFILGIVPFAAMGEANIMVLSAADASFTGEGLSLKNKQEPTTYDTEKGLIINVGDDTEITYKVPEDYAGVFDIYLNVSKIMAAYGSQPFAFTIGDGALFSVPIQCEKPAEFNFSFKDPACRDWLMEQGTFFVRGNVQLKGGEEIHVYSACAAQAAKARGSVFPAVGDIVTPNNTPRITTILTPTLMPMTG